MAALLHTAGWRPEVEEHWVLSGWVPTGQQGCVCGGTWDGGDEVLLLADFSIMEFHL
jgi:hypothetical protein